MPSPHMKDERNLLSAVEGSFSDVGYIGGLPPGVNLPPFSGSVHQETLPSAASTNNYPPVQAAYLHQSGKQPPQYESTTQSSYYSRKNAQSQGSYTQQSTAGMYSH